LLEIMLGFKRRRIDYLLGSLCHLKSLLPISAAFPHTQNMRAAIPLLLTTGTLFSAVPNLLTNPGFESGALSPWAVFNSGTMSVVGSGAHSGSFCARSSNRTSTSAGLRQSVIAVAPPNRVLVGRAWVRTSSLTPVSVLMRMQQTDSSIALFGQFASAQIADEWTLMQGLFEFDVNGTLSVLNFYFNGAPAGVDIFVDDASLTVFDAAAPENLLANADLEAGATSWTRHGPGTVSVNATNAAHTGSCFAGAKSHRDMAWRRAVGDG
jgi:hypothetical protein